MVVCSFNMRKEGLLYKGYENGNLATHARKCVVVSARILREQPTKMRISLEDHNLLGQRMSLPLAINS